MPLFWRILLLNALGLLAAIALLPGPVGVSTPVPLTAATLLMAGLAAMRGANAQLPRAGLAPLQRLTRAMATIGLPRPGQRPAAGGQAEVAGLITTFVTLAGRLEEVRTTSSTRALSAQEAERRRSAREPHDQAGQTLAAVRLELERVAVLRRPSRWRAAPRQETTRAGLDGGPPAGAPACRAPGRWTNSVRPARPRLSPPTSPGPAWPRATDSAETRRRRAGGPDSSTTDLAGPRLPARHRLSGHRPPLGRAGAGLVHHRPRRTPACPRAIDSADTRRPSAEQGAGLARHRPHQTPPARAPPTRRTPAAPRPSRGPDSPATGSHRSNSPAWPGTPGSLCGVPPAPADSCVSMTTAAAPATRRREPASGGMRERALLVGADLAPGRPGGGTEVRHTVPVPVRHPDRNGRS
ncbi:sensor histidine kinase [Streptomyces hawaiiensis]|uniref:sensor histidine kinase n=1 Tax=Streptomyces hawaiiensis TaxID=67305 RepID=UPI00364E952B